MIRSSTHTLADAVQTNERTNELLAEGRDIGSCGALVM